MNDGAGETVQGPSALADGHPRAVRPPNWTVHRVPEGRGRADDRRPVRTAGGPLPRSTGGEDPTSRADLRRAGSCCESHCATPAGATSWRERADRDPTRAGRAGDLRCARGTEGRQAVRGARPQPSAGEDDPCPRGLAGQGDPERPPASGRWPVARRADRPRGYRRVRGRSGGRRRRLCRQPRLHPLHLRLHGAAQGRAAQLPEPAPLRDELHECASHLSGRSAHGPALDERHRRCAGRPSGAAQRGGGLSPGRQSGRGGAARGVAQGTRDHRRVLRLTAVSTIHPDPARRRGIPEPAGHPAGERYRP